MINAETIADQCHAFPAAPLTGEVDTVSDAAWEGALARFEDGHYEQTACYIGGQRGERGSHLLLRQAGIPVAGARVALYTLPGLRNGLALVRFGPFWRRRDRKPDLHLYRSVIEALVAEYCDRRGHCLTLRPRAHPEFYRQECQVLEEFGFVARRKMPAPDRYLVDLSLDEAAQMQSFDQKWRYNLRHALANDFDIRLCDSAADIEAFRCMHQRMVARKNIRYAGMDMVNATPDLMRLPEPIRMRLVLAFHGGRPIAGATIGVLGDTAYYVLGASDDAALAAKAGYAMQWWIVRWLAGQNARWYDLGGTGEDGLRQFKKGFIGKRGAVVTFHGEYDYWTQSTARLATDVIYTLRDTKSAVQRWRGSLGQLSASLMSARLGDQRPVAERALKTAP